MKVSRRIAVAALAIVLALGAYWWWSPVHVLHQMQAAGARGDAEGISEHVDYPALRENLRAQYADRMARRIGEPKDNPLSALGNMIGMAFVNQLIDAIVRPEALAAALATGVVRPQGAASASAPGSQRAKTEWATEHQGFDRMLATPHETGQPPDADAPVLVFVRHGFADWKLSNIRLGARR